MITVVPWARNSTEPRSAWAIARMRALGIEVEIDAAGNLFGRWQAGSGKAVLVGSHLDTVPAGGRLDGAVGVVAAVHAVELLQREGFAPERPLSIVAFMDEEGTRFNAALFGSRAFAGESLEGVGDRLDAAGTTLRDAMHAAGYDLGRVGSAAPPDERRPCRDLHLEQGPVLAADGIDIGVV